MRCRSAIQARSLPLKCPPLLYTGLFFHYVSLTTGQCSLDLYVSSFYSLLPLMWLLFSAITSFLYSLYSLLLFFPFNNQTSALSNLGIVNNFLLYT